MFTALALWIGAAARLHGGGSGLNVVVVVNQNSADSLQLGNYYCERRGVPPQNVLRITWTGGRVTWSRADFESVLRVPLNVLLGGRGPSNQIDYVVLSMDIPYRVGDSGGGEVAGTNSTTAALFYGFKPDGNCSVCPPEFPGCGLAPGSANAYAGSEAVFRETPPIDATSNSWLAMMLTSDTLANAKAVVDRSVISDYGFPTQRVYLVKTSDAARNIRHLQFDDAILDVRVREVSQLERANTDSLVSLGPHLGGQFGRFGFFSLPAAPTLYLPGALADSLTSFGGFLFEPSGHTNAVEFLNAGAIASHGTVVEPCAYLEKYAAPRNYFYQSRGFTAAESYYQSLTNPYQGILVGEPLAAPFARPGSGDWLGLPEAATLSGVTNLNLALKAADTTRPLQQVDLFLDGYFLLTVSNIPPQRFNTLYVTLNGFTTNYAVPLGATVKSVTSGLAAQLNNPAFSLVSGVSALAHGDRIELQGMDVNLGGAAMTASVSNFIGAVPALTTRVLASRTNFLDTTAQGRREFQVVGPVVVGDYLELTVTRTNGVQMSVAVTNLAVGNSLQNLMQSLLNAVNSAAALMGADGVVAEDLVVGAIGTSPAASFNLRARTPGWKEAQVQAQLAGTFAIAPATAGALEDNLADLRPRNHLYIVAGLTNWNLAIPLDTTVLADGYHELTAVAYEGSHVRTPKRISRNVRIQNRPLTATFTTLLGGINTALNATLQFRVVANTNDASMNRIELFSTGGQWGVLSNLATATFALPATNLHLGLHPVYALVTRNDGQQYRTETKWLRIVEAESPFQLSVVAPTPVLAWPATAGRRYEIHSTTNLAIPFTLRDAVVPTNSSGVWTETNAGAPRRLYRALAIP